MSKPLPIGATALLLLIGVPAHAEWRSTISGGDVILPPHFILRTAPSEPPEDAPDPVPTRSAWALPLVDRTLSQADKDTSLAPELIDAVNRIEPMYDPTRLEGPDFPPVFGIRAGTAAMDNVFADRWRMASPDANISRLVHSIGMAWNETGVIPCSGFAKDRPHAEDEPALTNLSEEECAALETAQAYGFSGPWLVPIVTARISVPVFAAPMPGSRLSSRDFWAAQRARIAVIQQRLRNRVRDHQAMIDADEDRPALTRIGLRQ